MYSLLSSQDHFQMDLLRLSPVTEEPVQLNDNNFDGIINNLPEPDPAEALRQQARQSEQTATRDSVLEELKAQREKAELAEKAKRRPQLFRDPDERERV